MITIRTLGLAYLEENKLAEAETEFKKLTTLVPDDVLGYANLGLVYLRMGKYEEAEQQLKQAIERNSDDPDVRLILAKVYEVDNRMEESLNELNSILEIDPEHVKALYNLAELFTRTNDENSLSKREEYLKRVVENVPANLVPRLKLIEVEIQRGQFEEALSQIEEIEKIMPKFPPDAGEFFNKALELVKSSDENALTQMIIFHNFLKLTSLYQYGIQELKGPGGPLVGFPVITFGQSGIVTSTAEQVSIVEAIRFTDVSESAGLEFSGGTKTSNTHISIADFDGDGDADIYFGGTTGNQHFLFRNDLGKFTDIASEAGLAHSGKEYTSVFADFDNDGHLDLFISGEGENLLYRNSGPEEFTNVTTKSGLQNGGRANLAMFFDMDHEGDLDLFLANSEENKLFRNNADGTFLDRSEILSAKVSDSRDAGFTDFDNDGDIDFIVINKDGSNRLYTNLRQGSFRDVTIEAGLQNGDGSTAVAIGDYNNDGYPDLFISGESNIPSSLYRNKRDGTFEEDTRSDFSELVASNVNDVAFFDFDNDGFLDLVTIGESLGNSGGMLLYHNTGDGIFENVSHILPSNVASGNQVAIADYNEDGDLDIYVAGKDGQVHLLRNDGGNANHYLKIQLVGLRTGSGKNNHFGIGAKLEIRAGDLYQMKTVSEPFIHFGLGNRSRADVVRILWTNGVPQNLFTPNTNQNLVEEQVLKGSCPFLYTWNGERYVFVKDMMWRSALGMPLGIMSGSTAYAFPDASEEYLKIPGELLKPKNGKYSLKITSELWEAIYFDKLSLIVLDHPDSLQVFVDEKFIPPPFPDFEIFSISGEKLPTSAWDESDRDVLSLISKKDNVYISDFIHTDYQGIVEIKDLFLDAGENDNQLLFLNGWIFPTDASINVAISQTPEVKAIPPYLQVVNQEGNWETVIDHIGFPMGKNKTIIVDLEGKFLSVDHRIRIRTNMEIYWDHIFFSNRIESTTTSFRLEPIRADLHFRGFSWMYRKGKDGPHWFDYNETTGGQKWRDLSGNYTRFGDVQSLLLEADSKYVIMNAGDEVSIEFNATQIPELPAGWKRDFFIFSTGWVKDGDMNTATGNTVQPLPFHGMSRYPYGSDEAYPSGTDYDAYQQEFNTRKVTLDDFNNAISSGDDN